MRYIWSYFLVALCLTVTSARIMDYPGNRNGFQDNVASAVKDEKVLTPPTSSGLIIDSNGYPGNSNGKAGVTRTPQELKTENIKTEELPLFFNKILTALFNQGKETSNYEIVPFSKEDILNMENSDICKIMCSTGVEKPPCKCK